MKRWICRIAGHRWERFRVLTASVGLWCCTRCGDLTSAPDRLRREARTYRGMAGLSPASIDSGDGPARVDVR